MNTKTKENKRVIVTKTYQAVDGKMFENRHDCIKYERQLETVSNIKKAFSTVFDNSDDVYQALVDGLNVMLETDRKTVLNGLINLTIERKSPVRKTKVTKVETVIA